LDGLFFITLVLILDLKMYAKAAVLALAVAIANAQLSAVESDWSKLISAVVSADNGVKSWDGTLAGAVTLLPLIQAIGSDLTTINSAVSSLSTPVSESDGQALFSIIQPDVVSVQNLLKDTGSIASKASAVQAQDIVSSLVSSLQPQFLTLIAGIYSHAPCDLASTAIGIAAPIISSYFALDSTYGIPTIAAPATPSACAASGGSAASSAAPASSAASAASSAAAASGSPASSGAVSSAASSKAASTTAAVTTSAKSNSTGNFTTSAAPSTKTSSGGANLVLPGGLAAAIGVAAMLF
jgi:trimeric autotransporter adhesin